MKNNPIRKMHVGWNQDWLGGSTIIAKQPKPVRQWVAICSKCKVTVKAKQTYYYGRSAKNTRKLAKDALHQHMRSFH